MIRYGASALLLSQTHRGLAAAAISQPVFAFGSGSRYEQHDEANLGVRFLLVTGQSGALLGIKLSKNLFLVPTTLTRTNPLIAIPILGGFIQPALKTSDMVNVQQEMEHDLKHQSPYELIVEGAYSAAFRNGPSAYPLLLPVHQIGSIRDKRSQQFIKLRWLAGEAALIAVNIDHGRLLIAKGSASTSREFVQQVNGVSKKDMNEAIAHHCSQLSLSNYGQVGFQSARHCSSTTEQAQVQRRVSFVETYGFLMGYFALVLTLVLSIIGLMFGINYHISSTKNEILVKVDASLAKVDASLAKSEVKFDASHDDLKRRIKKLKGSNGKSEE